MISVIIPTCNRNELLSKCLDKLNPEVQTADAGLYEVIVSDDSKDNVSKKFIETNYHWIKWVEGPKKGPASNRNNGAKHANGEWLVFIDDDCVPGNTLLSEYLKGVKDHSDCLAFEGAIYPDDVELLKKDMAECPVNTEGGCFWSANICVNASLFKQIGGFDEKFVIAAQEDQALYERILKNTKVPFCRSCVVVHPVRYKKLNEKIKRIPIEIKNWIIFSKNKHSWPEVFFSGFASQVKACIKTTRQYKFKMMIYHLLSLVYLFPGIILYAVQNRNKQEI